MKKGTITALRYAVLAAILLFSGWYISNNYERFASGANFNRVNISLLIGLNLLTIVCESVRLKFQVRKLGYNLGLSHSWHILTVIQALNHMILKAGTFSGGYYMSKRYNISFHAYCAFIITYVVIMVLASGIFGFFVSLGFMVAGFDVEVLLPVFFGFVILSSASFIGIASVHIPLKWFPKILRRFIISWKEIYSDYRLIVVMIIVEIFYYLSCSLRFLTAVSMFSGNVTFLEGVTVVTIGNFLRVASIVPGGLGIAEVASGWTAGILGADAGLSGLSAGLDRLVYFMLVMIFGGIGFLTLSGRSEFHKPPEQKNNGMANDAVES